MLVCITFVRWSIKFTVRRGDFRLMWHQQLSPIVAASGGLILVSVGTTTAFILGGEQWSDQLDGDVRIIYLVHQLGLLVLGLSLLVLGGLGHLQYLPEILNLEYVATVSYVCVFVLAPLSNPWRISNAWGKNPEVWSFTHEQGETQLVLAMNGAITVLCVFSRLRVQLLWLPVAAGSISYVAVTESCEVMPDGQPPSHITELMFFVFAAISLVAAWRRESVARQNYLFNVKNGLIDSSSVQAPAHAMARVLKVLCDAVLEVDSALDVISADGLVGPIFGESVVGLDLITLMPNEEYRIKILLEKAALQPCTVLTMTTEISRQDKRPKHVEVFAVCLGSEEVTEVTYQYLLGLRLTSDARIPNHGGETRRKPPDRLGGWSDTSPYPKKPPGGWSETSSQAGSSGRTPQRPSFDPWDRTREAGSIASTDLDEYKLACKPATRLRRSLSWPPKEPNMKAKRDKSGSPKTPPQVRQFSPRAGSARSPSLDDLPRKSWDDERRDDDGMDIPDEPAACSLRQLDTVFEVTTTPIQTRLPAVREDQQPEMENGHDMEVNEGDASEDDVPPTPPPAPTPPPYDLDSQPEPYRHFKSPHLEHQDTVETLHSTLTAVGPIIVEPTGADRRRRLMTQWATERALLGSVTLPTEVFFESDDPLVLDQLRCTIIGCGLRLRRFGLRPGDCITHVDNEAVNDSVEFRRMVCDRWERGVAPTLGLTFRRVQEWKGANGIEGSDDNSSDKVTWRSMSSKAAGNGMGLPSKALHDAKAKEFWKKTRLNRTSSSIGSAANEEKSEQNVHLRLSLRRLSRTSSCLASKGSEREGNETPPDLETLYDT